VTGRVPEGKCPEAIDQKLIARYGITWKKWERARRKSLGLANLQYIRHRDFFVLLASDGEHIFKAREAIRLQDARRKGIRYGGYLISFRNGHVQVRLDDETYRQLKSYYVDLATRRRADALIAEFYAAPFEPYAPVKRQMFNILREVNRKRKTAGLSQLPSSAIWLKRRIVKPFETCSARISASATIGRQTSVDLAQIRRRELPSVGTADAVGLAFQSVCTLHDY